MEFTSLLDTSLDLNTKPLRLLDDGTPPGPISLKQEVHIDYTSELGRNVRVKEERSALMEELNRVSAENKKLTELLTVMCENYNELRNQLMECSNKNNSNNTSAMDNNVISSSRKRKSAENNVDGGIIINGPAESSSSDEDSSKKPREEQIKAKVSRVCVRTEASDTSLIVKDGYQWRKYGQKVTRDNPSPRAYFKCSFAPSCPVKKKVQRSIEDQSILVATYEGEHNHPHPSKLEANGGTSSGSSRCVATLGSVPCSTSLSSSGPTITFDLTKSRLSHDTQNSTHKIETPEFQQFLVEQMASNLTKDPKFKAALAAAISGKFLKQSG